MERPSRLPTSQVSPMDSVVGKTVTPYELAIQIVYKPGAVQRLWEANWDGFNLSEAEFSYDADRDTQVTVTTLLDAINAKGYRKDLRTRDAAEIKPWW